MNKLRILIIGGGGREHAVGWKVAQSSRAGQLYFAPGNAGTASLGQNVPIFATDIPALVAFAKKENIDLTLALPDDPLALGIVDEFKKQNLRIWGPTMEASKIEWSKAFAKDFMVRHGIPTAKYVVFTEYNKAAEYVEKQSFPLVVKANGLALGKGVTIAQNAGEALSALRDILVNKVFGDSGSKVVIEEYLEGIEMSIHAFSDGNSWKLFPTSQDNKRLHDGGLNTGGIGTIAPLSFISEEQLALIEKEVVGKAIKGMAEEGTPFVGCLYPGIMMTKEGPKVFEYNARMGDPETQIYMRLLDSDFIEMVDASIDGKISDFEIKWKTGKFACNITLASLGYPGKYDRGHAITGIEEAEKNKNVIVFHAGTLMKDGKLVTNGGRVLGVSAVGDSLKETLNTAYKAIEEISFTGMQYRKDIGAEALKMTN